MKLNELTPRPIDSITARAYPATSTFDDPDPYVVYRTLLATFGPPNATAGKHGQWCYELEAAQGMVRIQDWKLYGWALEIYPDNHQKAIAEALRDGLLALFAAEGRRQAPEIKQLARASQQFMLQNPFRIYFDSADDLLAMAEQDVSQQQRDTLCRSAFFLYLSSFEGLLNLLYELYLRSGIQANPDARGTVTRSHLDQKIHLAPVYCMCFTGDTIDFPGDLYKRYGAIRALRNSFIHANMSNAMRTAAVRQDGILFLLEPERSKDYDLPLVISGLNVAHLRFTRQTIAEMKDAILNAMSVHYRHDFGQALEREEIMVEVHGDHYLIRKQL